MKIEIIEFLDSTGEKYTSLFDLKACLTNQKKRSL